MLFYKWKVEGYLFKGGKLEYYGKKEEIGSVIFFFEDYIDFNYGLNFNIFKSYKIVLKWLCEYVVFIGESDIVWLDIDKFFYYDFLEWVL